MNMPNNHKRDSELLTGNIEEMKRAADTARDEGNMDRAEERYFGIWNNRRQGKVLDPEITGRLGASGYGDEQWRTARFYEAFAGARTKGQLAELGALVEGSLLRDEKKLREIDLGKEAVPQLVVVEGLKEAIEVPEDTSAAA